MMAKRSELYLAANQRRIVRAEIELEQAKRAVTLSEHKLANALEAYERMKVWAERHVTT